MTSIHELYGTDTNAEVSGVVHKITNEISFKLARAGGSNGKYTKTLEAKSRPYRRQIQEDKLDVDVANSMLVETFAECVVLDWTGITDAKGKKVAFSKDNCVKLLTDYPDLFAELREVASRSATFRS
jgi:hypothetical protein